MADDKKKPNEEIVRDANKMGRGTVTKEFRDSVRRPDGTFDFTNFAATFRAPSPRRVSPEEAGRIERAEKDQQFHIIVDGLSSRHAPRHETQPIVRRHHDPDGLSEMEVQGYFRLGTRTVNIAGYPFDITDSSGPSKSLERSLEPLASFLITKFRRKLGSSVHIDDKSFLKDPTLTVNELMDKSSLDAVVYLGIEKGELYLATHIIPMEGVVDGRAVYQIATDEGVKGAGVLIPKRRGVVRIREIARYW